MTDKRFILSDFFWEVLDTKYDWFGRTEPFSEEVIEEEDYLLIGRAKTQEDGENICKLLNKLIEENEQLREIIEELREVIEEGELSDMAKLRYQWSQYQDSYYKSCWGHYELKGSKK